MAQMLLVADGDSNMGEIPGRYSFYSLKTK